MALSKNNQGFHAKTAPEIEIGRVARAMLNDSIPYLEGAIALESLRHDIGAYENDPDFMPFVAIMSDIDQLPCDTEAEHWFSAAMQTCRSEVEESVKWAKEISLVQCESLAQRY